MSSSVRFHLSVAVAACVVVASVAVWALNSSSQRGVIQPGSIVFSAEDQKIHRLIYRTDQMTLTARRSEAGGRFAVEIHYRAGRPMQRCESTPDLGGTLPKLVEITATRELNPTQAAAEFPVQLGVLELEDEITGEPIPPFTVRAPPDRSAIALAYQETAFEAALDSEVFARLEQGCAALAER